MKIGRQSRFEDLPEYLTPEDVAAYLGIGRSATYEAIRRGDLPHLRIGRLLRIPRAALQVLTARPATAVERGGR